MLGRGCIHGRRAAQPALMSFLHDWLGRVTKRAEPTRRQTLEAHIEALRDRFGPASRAASKGSLSVVNPAGLYRVVVESGLVRVEVHCLDEHRFAVSVPCDALLTEPPERAAVSGRRWADHGLFRADQRPNFEKEVRLASGSKSLVVDVADEVEALLFDLFGRPRDSYYSVAIEKETPPEAEPLLDSIRRLVKSKNHDVRREVYQQVINGRFYLPLQPTLERDHPPSVHASPELFGDRPVWAVFTDLEALTAFRQDPQPYVLISGIRLVQAALAHGLGSIRINPESAVGGELYMNELEALANYLHRLGLMDHVSTSS